MATRSTIGIVRGYHDTTRIYCHWDGYIEWNGAILQKYYSTAEKVEALMALGNLSSLGPEIGPDDPHMWDLGYNDGHRKCRTYTSRGEEWAQCPADQREEYNYTFLADEGVWTVETTISAEPEDMGKALGFDKLWKSDTRYLIDELNELSQDAWKRMAPRDENDWGITLEGCVAAAKEAREPVNERKRQEYEAYYRAYCD